MKITAHLESSFNNHGATVTTEGVEKSLHIPPKSTGSGSAINGGELLFLALATCCCNDLYREAARRGISVQSIKVDVDGEFGKEGEPASRISYHVKVESNSAAQDVQALIQYVDEIAEVHNTLRKGIAVTLQANGSAK